jgi:hypothetical protein
VRDLGLQLRQLNDITAFTVRIALWPVRVRIHLMSGQVDNVGPSYGGSALGPWVNHLMGVHL